ncbi:MAG: ATP-binding protein, partial [Nannocystaceae bacterium]
MSEQHRPEQSAAQHKASSLAEAPAAVLDAIHEVIVVCDANGRMEQFSDRLCDITGVAREQLLGQELAIHDVQLAEPETWRGVRAELAEQKTVRRFGELRHVDGSKLRVEWTVHRVNHNNRLYEVWAARSLTPGAPAKLSHLEQERGQLARVADERARELQRINGELEQALRAKDDFFAGISHEFRTPLNAILGLSEALLEDLHGPLNPGQSEYVSGIVESGRHLLSLINDILDISRYRAGGMELDTAPSPLREIYEASIRMVRPAIKAKHLTFSIKDDEKVTTLVADERRLRQMLVNLLANACKFTPEGGSIGLEVLGSSQRQEVTLTVWDTGVGIPAEQIDRLFKPFVQLESGLSNNQPGTGLGLSLVLAMAELHGGSVQVESELGRGSRFTITLPWSGSNLGNQPSSPELTPNWDAQSFTGQTLTEDNPMINASEIVALARQAASGNLAKRKPSV